MISLFLRHSIGTMMHPTGIGRYFGLVFMFRRNDMFRFLKFYMSAGSSLLFSLFYKGVMACLRRLRGLCWPRREPKLYVLQVSLPPNCRQCMEIYQPNLHTQSVRLFTYCINRCTPGYLLYRLRHLQSRYGLRSIEAVLSGFPRRVHKSCRRSMDRLFCLWFNSLLLINMGASITHQLSTQSFVFFCIT